LSRLLDDQDVPEENRWCVVNPTFVEKLRDENSKLMDTDFNGGTGDVRNGRVTSSPVRSFTVYKTNNAPGISTSATSNADVVMAGHISSTATASQIAKTEVLRSERFFGDIVRGLHLYGRKTLRPEAMVKMFWLTD
jgi:hypothetical protein